ncbi:MAG: hypothetical protein R3352_08270, partial [Salinisphaeraceae bacterium]|nr:hypothetical protein [Salinisphaeraceae bacterium]
MSSENPANIVVAALYHFARLPDFREFRRPLVKLGEKHDLTGTILLAEEGVNGTIAGSRAGVDAILDLLRSDERLKALEHKESYTDERPFYRFKVKLKKEIVTMGVPDT